MKTIITIATALLLICACKEEKKNPQPVIHDSIEISKETARKMKYPVSLKEVLKAHGGINRWNTMNNICFEITSRTGTEKHTVSLPDRRTKIESGAWSIVNDGQHVWLDERRENAYKGNARFYHNRMFYFYTMPFILGDAGVQYSEVKGTELEGTVYEGIKINYKTGIGDSPNDEYILYYHPETYKMEWLGYTVTYNDNEKNDTWNYIKYGAWQDVNGLLLPRTLTWYTVIDGKPVQARNNVSFNKVTITETMLDDSLFVVPEGAEKIVR